MTANSYKKHAKETIGVSTGNARSETLAKRAMRRRVTMIRRDQFVATISFGKKNFALAIPSVPKVNVFINRYAKMAYATTRRQLVAVAPVILSKTNATPPKPALYDANTMPLKMATFTH